MKRKIKSMLKKTLFVLFLVVANNSYSQIISDIFDYGEVENNKYFNSFFNFKMDIPSGWIVKSRDQIDNSKVIVENILADDDENLKSKIKASEINSAILLSVSQFEIGKSQGFNPNLVISVENIQNLRSQINETDYLLQVRKLLLASPINYSKIDSSFVIQIIYNEDFYVMNAEIKIQGKTITQSFYTYIIYGFVFGVTISYENENQRNVLSNSITSMKFNNFVFSNF